MTRALRYNDELRELGSEKARWRLVELMPRDGCVKMFDREKLVEVVKALPAINKDIVDGKLILLRKDAPRLSAAAQNDPKLDKAIESAMYFIRGIEELRNLHCISVNQAYNMATLAPTSKEGEASESLPSRASIYRYLAAKRNDLPILKGDKNKGNRRPRYSEDVVDLV